MNKRQFRERDTPRPEAPDYPTLDDFEDRRASILGRFGALALGVSVAATGLSGCGFLFGRSTGGVAIAPDARIDAALEAGPDGQKSDQKPADMPGLEAGGGDQKTE